MQPNIMTIDGADHRIFTGGDGANYPASGIETYALRRIFNLTTGSSRVVDFLDLPGFWSIHSVYISSPEDSEITIEILDSNGVAFFEDKLQRHETPKTMPVALINSSLTLKLTASRNDINLALIYLKPAHLAYSKDFLL